MPEAGGAVGSGGDDRAPGGDTGTGPGGGTPRVRVLPGAPSPLRQYCRAALSGPVRAVLSGPVRGVLSGPVRGVLSGGRGRADGFASTALRLEAVTPRREHVARYGELIGGWSGDRLPPLYPHLLGFPLQLQFMTGPGFPFPVLGLVHVTNVVRAARPLPLGAPLDVEVRLGAPAEHPRGRTVDLLTEVSAEGVVVWTGTSTYLHREPRVRRGAGEGGGLVDRSGAAGGSPGDGDHPGGGRGGDAEAEELSALHLSARWRLSGELGRRYAAVSGDRNPIHLYPWAAKAFGFPRAIAHGMWTAAATVAAVENRLPDAPVLTVRFRRPILLPSTVRLFTAVTPGRVLTEVRGREGSGTVHLVASVYGGGTT